MSPAPGQSLLDRLAPRSGEQLLAIGDPGAGIDTELRRRGARVTWLEARSFDDYGAEFDRAFEIALCVDALPWMRGLDRFAAGVARALVPGGRLGFESDWADPEGVVAERVVDALRDRGVDPALANPWLLETPERFAERLASAGFAVEPFEQVATAAVPDFVASLPLLAASSTALPPGARPAFLAELGHALRACFDGAGDGRSLGVQRFSGVARRLI